VINRIKGVDGASLRIATTAAPTFRRNMSPFALATKPARSIKAFVSVEHWQK